MVVACCLMIARASASSALVSGAVRSLKSMGPSPRMSHSAERSGKVRRRRSASKVLRTNHVFIVDFGRDNIRANCACLPCAYLSIIMVKRSAFSCVYCSKLLIKCPIFLLLIKNAQKDRRLSVMLVIFASRKDREGLAEPVL